MINLKTATRLAKYGLRTGAHFIKQKAPTLLTIFGVCLLGGAIVDTIVEAPKCRDDIQELDQDENLTHNEYLKKKVKVILYHYWLIMAMSAIGAGCIFWSDKLSLGETAAAIAAYNMKSDELEKLKQKMINTDGKRHADRIQEEVYRDRIKKDDADGVEIYDTHKGTQKCYDVITGRRFYHDIEKIRKAENDINKWINESLSYGDDIDVELNEWYNYLGLKPVKTGSKMGWHNQLINLNLQYVKDDNDEPCLVIGYRNAPQWGFDQIGIDDRNICSDDWCERAGANELM